MTLQFPNNPSNGQQYTASNNLIYVWDGEKWITTGSAQAAGDYVNRTGDVMTGQLGLPGGGSAADAIQKQEVQSLISAIDLTPYVEKAGSTMTGDLTVPSLNGGQLAGFRNQLINGNFTCNQRNLSDTPLSLPSSAYIVDRWQLQSSDGQPIACSIQGGDLAGGSTAFIDISGTAQTVFILQYVELGRIGAHAQFSPNEEWTVSWWGGNIEFASCSFSEGTGGPAGTTWTATAPRVIETTSGGATRQAVTVTVTGGGGAGESCVAVVWKNVAINVATSFYSAQFEPGPVATPFEQRPIALELSLCQRYFEASGTPGVSRGARWHTYRDGGGTPSTGRSGIPHYFKVPKRVVPTVTFFSYDGTSGAVSSTTGGGTTTLVGPLQGTQTDLHCSLWYNNVGSSGTVQSFWGDFYADAEL